MATLFYSSRSGTQHSVSLKEAVMKGQADNGGLFVPVAIPSVSADFISHLSQLSDAEIVEELSVAWLEGSVNEATARKIAREAINFTTPLIQLDAYNHVLELFHGPTLAFKDYGARYMARLLSHFLREERSSQTILVATSGDTGSAVAAGFLGLENIRVVVLYPKGRVSALQEMQMTTLDRNVTAVELEGNFDDCQSLVKSAFADEELRRARNLNSANSINIARLIAQTFYYFLGYARIFRRDAAPVFSVPSGNLGNLSAGILAKRMGLPVHCFVAATNVNDVFVEYLATGDYAARASLHTMSNAMDVGRPSNLERLTAFYASDLSQMKRDIVGFSVNDALTAETMSTVANQYGYILDPHTAVGYRGLLNWRLQTHDENRPGIVLATAHPAKFLHDVEKATGREIALPPSLAELQNRKKKSVVMENSFVALKKWLMKL